ncbi:MAG: type II secretion system GspH family protein [Acidobacteriota bacterium]|jgi:prepilin-type N-terminal cleavage/methylation domain-containing protein|nr:type II secretion system GspH family protein [Acidobacteriota bacterium]
MTLGETACEVRRRDRGVCRQAGFSLLEIIVLLAIVGLLASLAVVNFNSMMPGMRANRAATQVAAILRDGRTAAMAGRHNIHVVFNADGMQLNRQNADGTITILHDKTQTFSPDVKFEILAPVDTPDGFGRAQACTFGGGGAAETTFSGEGMLVNFPDPATPVNGSIFLGVPGNIRTARAVTVLGAIGAVHIWRWDTGTNTWQRQ